MDLGLHAELAVLGIRAAPPLRRRSGAGPSDDGPWVLNGAPTTGPIAGDTPSALRDDGALTRDGVIVDVDLRAVRRPRFYDLQTAEVRERWTPGKATISLDEYEAAWREAVRIFGSNRVSTYLLIGLGENPDELVKGAQRLIGMGVYPFVVPYRPLAGGLAHADGVPAPSHEIVADITDRVGSALRKADMRGADQGAGCAACGACSALGAVGG